MKLLGALAVILGCGGTGLYMALLFRREERTLRELGRMLEEMKWELQYRLTPLPELCRACAGRHEGAPAGVLRCLAEEMEGQIFPDAARCMDSALAKTPKLSDRCRRVFGELGRSLGKFDLSGQLESLEQTRQFCQTLCSQMSCRREERLRSFETLGLCAGAALAILFL